MAAAGAGLRKSGKSRAKSSNQGWSPNSGQDAEPESASLVDVFVSEQGQHSSSSGLALPQQQNQQAGTQMQPASSMNQPQSGLTQYQPTGTTPEPPTVRTLDQCQPTGNNETPLAGVDLNSDAIVDAQLTHLISRDDAPQGQDAPNASDVPMPDTPTVHDIATPRRTVGQSVIPSLMTITQSLDTDSLFRSTPLLRAQLTQLQSTISKQMNKPTLLLKPLGAALRLQTTQKKQVSTIQRNIHKQLYNSLTDTPTEQAIHPPFTIHFTHWSAPHAAKK